MPTLVGSSPGSGTRPALRIADPSPDCCHVVYARERMEDAIRAVAEDAMSPNRPDVLPWHAEAAFDDDLDRVIRDIAASANLMLAERLEDLVASAPPSVVGRMSSVPRWPEQA